jgi:hypothetical protein
MGIDVRLVGPEHRSRRRNSATNLAPEGGTMQFTRRTRLLTAAAVTVLASTATVALSPAPASAVGPGFKQAHYIDTRGVNSGSGTVNPKSTDHYDIAVADKSSDGLRVCLVIQVAEGDKPVRDIPYCDDNNTGAAQHYQIYYDWYDCYLTVGRGWINC